MDADAAPGRKIPRARAERIGRRGSTPAAAASCRLLWCSSRRRLLRTFNARRGREDGNQTDGTKYGKHVQMLFHKLSSFQHHQIVRSNVSRLSMPAPVRLALSPGRFLSISLGEDVDDSD
jgi:hypothetical protein